MSGHDESPPTGELANPVSKKLGRDALAGVINAIAGVPDGMAAAALVGVNPINGLYTSIVAPIAGGLLASTQLLYISATSASAVMAAQAISDIPAGDRSASLFLLVALVGLFLIAFGLLKLGQLVRFVSHAVMTGFLAGVAVVLILDQLPLLVGANSGGRNKLEQSYNLFKDVSRFDWQTMVAGGLAMVVGFGLLRSRLRGISPLFALVIPSLLVAAASWHSVQRVNDLGAVPRGLVAPDLPALSLFTPTLLVSAFAIAVVIALYGAGVSNSVENPDGSDIDSSRDMLAQGVANVASGVFSGIPAGGSVSQTALNAQSGAQSRLGSILGGLGMAGIVWLVPGLLGNVPMSVLAALMIIAGIHAIDFDEIVSSWKASDSARWPIIVTFLATLLLSVPLAFVSGILITIAVFLSTSASDVHVRELIPLGNGRFADSKRPLKLPERGITVLEVYGDLFFAGARTFADKLPDPSGAVHPVVILRLRGRNKVGATLADVLDRYADELADVGGRLYLTGVNEEVRGHLQRAGKLDLGGTVRLMPATPIIGESTEQAIADAREWLNGFGDSFGSE